MTEAKPGMVFVAREGKLHCLYTDELPLKQMGQVAVKRASHVDGSADLSWEAIRWLLDNQPEHWPEGFAAERYAKSASPIADIRGLLDAGAWWADLLPSKGPVLGPFATRQEALDAEVAWLRVNVFKVED